MRSYIYRIIALMLASVVLVFQAGCSFKGLGVNSTDFEPAKPVYREVNRRDTGAIYQAGMAVGLFDRVTARQVGDLITIVLEESMDASSDSNTAIKKDQKVDMPGPTIAGQPVLNSNGDPVLENKIDAKRDFKGQGNSAAKSSIVGRISVTVAEVQSNGNLIVRGQKLMLINKSRGYIQLSGIVRPQDIRPDNTVTSGRVADVKLAVAGSGTLNDANTMGLLAKFFQSPVWPY